MPGRWVANRFAGCSRNSQHLIVTPATPSLTAFPSEKSYLFHRGTLMNIQLHRNRARAKIYDKNRPKIADGVFEVSRVETTRLARGDTTEMASPAWGPSGRRRVRDKPSLRGPTRLAYARGKWRLRRAIRLRGGHFGAHLIGVRLRVAYRFDAREAFPNRRLLGGITTR